jgi:hypothetical protein
MPARLYCLGRVESSVWLTIEAKAENGQGEIWGTFFIGDSGDLILPSRIIVIIINTQPLQN